MFDKNLYPISCNGLILPVRLKITAVFTQQNLLRCSKTTAANNFCEPITLSSGHDITLTYNEVQI